MGANRNSWSGGSFSGSGFSTVKDSSSFAIKRGKKDICLFQLEEITIFKIASFFVSLTAIQRGVSLCFAIRYFKLVAEVKRMNHRHFHVGGQCQSEESDTPRVHDSLCAANQGKLSGLLHLLPQAKKRKVIARLHRHKCNHTVTNVCSSAYQSN